MPDSNELYCKTPENERTNIFHELGFVDLQYANCRKLE